MSVYYLLGIIFIGLGARYAVRGYAQKSTPRIVNGFSIILIGVAQFFRLIPSVGISIMALAIVVFMISLVMLSKQDTTS